MAGNSGLLQLKTTTLKFTGSEEGIVNIKASKY
jgi:hypothetical protein